MFRTPYTLFRTLAIAEVISWTLLIAGLLTRAASGWALGVTIAGGIHGFVFLAYGATVILVVLNNRWRVGPTIVALVSAIVPYATIPAELWAHRRGLLAGEWRVSPATDGGDARWYDGALAWFLRRPWVLVIVIAVAVAALFVILLVAGPPGGKG